MANIIHFADLPNGETVSSKRCDYDQGANKMGRIWIEGMGWVRATRSVTRKSMPSNHECDARCMNATGRTMQCECSCGGKNHGKGRFYCAAA
jgi:hypothetical protein